MDDNFVNTVIDFYTDKKWKDIVEKFHDYPERSKLLWVFPSEENLIFLKSCLFELNCDDILSIGCGSGLLEWIITEATEIPVRGVVVDCAWWHCKYAPPTFIPPIRILNLHLVSEIPVRGVEVDCAWWHCKYAPPTFIPLLITDPKLDKNVTTILHSSYRTALLFCYFNNRSAFEDYLRFFSGSVLVIIGPGKCKGVHADPMPFGDVDDNWILYKWTEVRNSGDFIAIYIKKDNKF